MLVSPKLNLLTSSRNPLQVIETSLANASRHGNLIYDFLTLRKQVFVDTLNWKIPHDQMVEMDQYDTPMAKYILVLQNGQVVGGTRLLPVPTSADTHAYMIGDALERRTLILPDSYPSNIKLGQPAWEGTRLVISRRLLKNQSKRSQCLGLILSGIQKVLHANHSTSLVTISSTTMPKLLHRYGLFPKQIHIPFTCTDDIREYAIFAIEFPKMVKLGRLTPKKLLRARPKNTAAVELNV